MIRRVDTHKAQAERIETWVKSGQLPRRMPCMIALAEALLHPKAIWLFGSRARGTHRPSSDIDLAIDFPEAYRSNWSRFVSEVEEGPYTLLHVDLVDLNHCPV